MDNVKTDKIYITHMDNVKTDKIYITHIDDVKTYRLIRFTQSSKNA